ncbi:VapE domain-containing protein [Roseomonas fluvialis]|uniref:Toprim domain-containing protein n=1 Tax=Roseomonas fluvialis TaxID=1750527 RepID=A0ABN6P088_9PROT|nr:VapE domain-containing protein [Roseomonas fluvialis]BDG71984.1 hypothetical protein Rmf_19130 [Roseomonas fluvialis]
MADDHYTQENASAQGSDYERSHDSGTTVKKARAEYRKGISQIQADHPVARYFDSRGLWPLQPYEREILRAQFHDVDGDTPEEDWSGFWLCAPLHDQDGSLVAIQRTSISKQGEKVRVAGRNDRITVGEAYGASIRLRPVVGDDGILYVAEGLEDAMSIARFTKGAAVCWAACGRRALEEIHLPPNLGELRICADNDPAGLESAQVLAMRAVLAGKKVQILASPVAGEDPNDAWLAKRDLNSILEGWIGRLHTYLSWRPLSEGETETRLKALAKSEKLTQAAIKAEWKAFIKGARPKRALVAGGVLESIEGAVTAGYRFNRDGVKPGDIVNALIAFKRIGLTARLDLFDLSIMLEATSPQALIVSIPGAPLHNLGEAVRLRDELLSPLVGFIALKDNVTFSENMVLAALKFVAHARRYHSMQDWLEAHGEWDGTPRLHLVLQNTFAAEDTPLNRWTSQALFVGQALRILYPGAKVDVMPVLCGESGKRKSSFVAEIAAGGRERCTDSPVDVHDPRKVLEQTRGKTVVEWAEMEGLGRSDWEAVKAHLTRTTDKGRLAYGRESTEVPRGFINVGTVNGMDFLRSQVGSRRFMPVEVPGLADLSFLREHWSQLWAEAVALAGAIIKGAGDRLPELAVPPDLWESAAALQSRHLKLNTWAQIMEPFLQPFPDAVVKTSDVKKFLIGHGLRSVPDNEIGEALRHLGFKRQASAFEFKGLGKWRGWWRGEKPGAADVDRRLLKVIRNDAIGKPDFTHENSPPKDMSAVDRASQADATPHAPTPGRAVVARTRGVPKAR